MCWSRATNSTLGRLCACSELPALHQNKDKLLSINQTAVFNSFQQILLSLPTWLCNFLWMFIFYLSLSSLWDLTSSLIFFFCVHWPVFYASLFLPSSVSPCSEKEVKLQCLFDGEICSVSLPFSWLSLNTFSLSLSLFFFLGWDAREFVWVFFVSSQGFVSHEIIKHPQSHVHQFNSGLLHTHACKPIPLALPSHLSAFFVSQNRVLFFSPWPKLDLSSGSPWYTVSFLQLS